MAVGKGGRRKEEFSCRYAFSSTAAHRLCSFVSSRKGPEEYSVFIVVAAPTACSPFTRGRILLFNIIQNERNKKHLLSFSSSSS